MKKCSLSFQNTTIYIFLLYSILLLQTLTAQKNSTWRANWIWTNEQGPNNSWVNFRKKIQLNSLPSTAITRIAAENKYWLYINDKLVIRDGALEARPNLKDTYYDEIDIAPYLKKGENIICALVWHKGGRDGYTQITLPDGGFIFESQLTGTNISSIVSDNTWKVTRDSAFIRGVFRYKHAISGSIKFDNATFGGEIIPGVANAGYYKPAGSAMPYTRCANENDLFQLPGKCDVAYGNENEQLKINGDYKWTAYPVTYDARNEKHGWLTNKYNDSLWKNATCKGIPPVSPWNNLVHRTIPFWKDYGLNPYLNQNELPKLISTNTTITGDLGINIQGTPYLKVKANAGVHVRIVLNDFYYQEYITKNGVQEFECFAWQNSSSHTVKYEFTNVTDTIQVLDLKFRQTSYDAEIIGSFNSNDESLNSLWTKCKNTSFVCMRDYYYDCPNRERGQWWGDVSEQILYSFYLYDKNSIKLAQKAYRELLYTQKDDGSLYTTAPGKAFNLPDQNMAAISLLWNYYLYTGDKNLLFELYPNVKVFIQKCASTANNDGMLIMEKSNGWNLWNWIDWGSNMDIQAGSANAVCNAMYIVLLQNMINIAKTVNIKSDIPYYEQLQSKVKANFNSYFWNGNAYAFSNKNGVQSTTTDDRSAAWAVLAGMVDSDKKTEVINLLKTRYDASPYQEMYIALALLQLDPVAALQRTRNRFSAMINSWSSTLWEEFPAHNSNNHAWSAGPMYHLSAFFLGIRPLKPGYEEFSFLPLVGDLKQISGTVPTPQNKITASILIDKSSSVITQKIISPANTLCVLGVPKHVLGKSVTMKEIKIGSDVIWQNGSPKIKIEGIEFYEEDDQFIKFKVNPGSWEVKAFANEPANIGIVSIISPITKIGLSTSETLIVKIINENKTAQTNVKITGLINNDLNINEVIPTIPALSTIEYAFTKKINLASLKDHKISVKIEAPSDRYSMDDTLSTTITNYAKKLDWALLFSGTGGGKISIPHSSKLTLNNAFTLEAWIFPMGFGSNYWENTIISKETNTSGYALNIGGKGQGRIVIYNNGWKEAVLPPGSIALNKWQHLAGTYNGKEIKIYLDGELKATTAVGKMTSSTQPLYIGETSAWSGREFNGGIDEVRIWGKALSDKEIQNITKRKITGKENGLLLYYNFNEGINSSIIKDKTSNLFDGALVNLDKQKSWMQSIINRKRAKMKK